MDASEKEIVKNLVAIAKDSIEANRRDHELLVLTAQKVERHEKSIDQNWQFTRKWVLKLGLAIGAVAIAAGVASEKIIKFF